MRAICGTSDSRAWRAPAIQAPSDASGPESRTKKRAARNEPDEALVLGPWQ